MDKLKDYARRDNTTLIGVSAGSMIMTPTIRTTAIYHQHKGDFDALNELGLSDFTGLGLVNFEFVPHFVMDTKGQYVEEFVRGSTNTIYGCPDGSGIVVYDDNIEFYGDVFELNNYAS